MSKQTTCDLQSNIEAFLPRRQATEVVETLNNYGIECACGLTGKRIPAFVITDQSVANPQRAVEKLHKFLSDHWATIVR